MIYREGGCLGYRWGLSFWIVVDLGLSLFIACEFLFFRFLRVIGKFLIGVFIVLKVTFLCGVFRGIVDFGGIGSRVVFIFGVYRDFGDDFVGDSILGFCLVGRFVRAFSVS